MAARGATSLSSDDKHRTFNDYVSSIRLLRNSQIRGFQYHLHSTVLPPPPFSSSATEKLQVTSLSWGGCCGKLRGPSPSPIPSQEAARLKASWGKGESLFGGGWGCVFTWDEHCHFQLQLGKSQKCFAFLPSGKKVSTHRERTWWGRRDKINNWYILWSLQTFPGYYLWWFMPIIPALRE